MCSLQDFNNFATPLAAIGTGVLLYMSFRKQSHQTLISEEQNSIQKIRGSIDSWVSSKDKFHVAFKIGTGGSQEIHKLYGDDAIDQFGRHFTIITAMQFGSLNYSAPCDRFAVLLKRLDGLHRQLESSTISKADKEAIHWELLSYTKDMCRSLRAIFEHWNRHIKPGESIDETYKNFKDFFDKYQHCLVPVLHSADIHTL